MKWKCFGVFDTELGGFLALEEGTDQMGITEFGINGVYWFSRSCANKWVKKKGLDKSRYKVQKWFWTTL
jgi:hypothetical protein